MAFLAFGLAGRAEGQATSSSSSTVPANGSGSTTTQSTRPATPSTSIIDRAADAGEPIQLPSSPVAVLDSPRSSARLASLGVEGSSYTTAVNAYDGSISEYKAAIEAVPRAQVNIDDALVHQQGATDRFNARVHELGDLLTARSRVQGELTSAARRRDKGDFEVNQIRVDLRDMAINEYIAGGFGGAPEQVLDFDNANQLGSRKVLLGLVKRDRMVELRSLMTYRDGNERLADEQQAQLDELTRRITTTEAARDQAVRDRQAGVDDERRARDEKARAEATVEEHRADVDERRDAVADARMTAVVPELGLPFVVVNAYVKAAERFAALAPSCGLRWTALAGIGRTESFHGTFGGATVDAEGYETKPIYGIPLDGSSGTANIGDTDDGALDDTASTDRAMGPMQFIPSSWRTLGLDGNGDGKAEPQNFYDATMSAANLLCRQGPGLNADDGMRRAFRSYNNDGHYVETVLDRTHRYDRYQFPHADAARDPAKDVAGLDVPGLAVPGVTIDPEVPDGP